MSAAAAEEEDKEFGYNEGHICYYREKNLLL
jgi:hypothetical protein